jgi:hypothetical protein
MQVLLVGESFVIYQEAPDVFLDENQPHIEIIWESFLPRIWKRRAILLLSSHFNIAFIKIKFHHQISS